MFHYNPGANPGRQNPDQTFERCSVNRYFNLIVGFKIEDFILLHREYQEKAVQPALCYSVHK